MVTGCDRQADAVKTVPDAIDGGDLVVVDGAQLGRNQFSKLS